MAARHAYVAASVTMRGNLHLRSRSHLRLHPRGVPRRALAVPLATEPVEAGLVAERTALVPGEPLTIALRLAIAPGWHTYWRNPGDSGLPTTLAWQLPAGVSAGRMERGGRATR